MTYKYRLRFNRYAFSAWYLTPSVRFGLHGDGEWFLGLTFIKMDLCLTRSKPIQPRA